ncbi:MAG TPA: M48 family metallopeptidase [Terriglobales bacterium]|nr:M48 family metallopeptidase [Terriglobales bacterium]
MKPNLSRRFLAYLLIAAIGVFPGCTSRRINQNPQTGRFDVSQGGYNVFSPEQEVQIGKQAAQEAMQQLPVLPENSPITDYVQQLGQRLASVSPGPDYPYQFHVVNQKEINAFALPGGPIFVNLGTIQSADDEGELAGVMAHEIAHIVLRHATSNISKQQAAQVPLAILGGLLGQGTGAQLARLGISLGANSIFLKYSRDAEREADLLGAQIMYDAGFNPYSMVEFFDELEQQGGPGGPQFLSDHPNPGNRERDVAEAVAKFPKKNFGRKDSPQFERIKQLAAKMKPLTAEQVAQRQREQQARMARAAQEQIQPSGQFQPLNHNAFAIAYPSNWQVFGDANSTVTIAPPAGVSQSAIAYGVVISGFRPQPGRDSLEIATQDLATTIARANPGMSVQGAQRTTVSGLPAMSVVMTGPSPLTAGGQTVAERDTLVTVQRQDGSVLFLIFIAPEPDMDVLSQTYSAMLRSFQIK